MQDVKYVFRFDDVSVSTDMEKLNRMSKAIVEKIHDSLILYAISPVVHNIPANENQERVFPGDFTARSDYRIFFMADKIGIPTNIPDYVTLAAHGMCHADHRLLAPEVAELSILMSCSLTKSKIFVPPYHKYAPWIQQICDQNKIALLKYEDGWKHMSYHPFSLDTKLYYTHTFDWKKEEDFYGWIEGC